MHITHDVVVDDVNGCDTPPDKRDGRLQSSIAVSAPQDGYREVYPSLKQLEHPRSTSLTESSAIIIKEAGEDCDFIRRS